MNLWTYCELGPSRAPRHPHSNRGQDNIWGPLYQLRSCVQPTSTQSLRPTYINSNPASNLQFSTFLGIFSFLSKTLHFDMEVRGFLPGGLVLSSVLGFYV